MPQRQPRSSCRYEIYDLTRKITWLRIAALVINLLLVTYLVWTRRLFGVRGGKTACEARLRCASIIEEEQATLSRGEEDHGPANARHHIRDTGGRP